MFFEAFPKQRKNAFIQQDILADINEFGNELYQYALKLAMTNVGIKRPNYKTVRKLK
jgi:DnaD/phage-associated family protein